MIFPRIVYFSYSDHICIGVASKWHPPLRRRRNIFPETCFTDIPCLTWTIKNHYFFLCRLLHSFFHVFLPPSPFSTSNAAFSCWDTWGIASWRSVWGGGVWVWVYFCMLHTYLCQGALVWAQMWFWLLLDMLAVCFVPQDYKRGMFKYPSTRTVTIVTQVI